MKEILMKENPVILLGDDFGTAVIQGAGTRIELGSDGRIAVYTNGEVKVLPASGAAAAFPVLKIGEEIEDGTIFAGVSPDTGGNMFVTQQEASGTFNWNAAMKYAAALYANGHKDWRLPTKAELDVLYQGRHKGALKGTFNESGSDLSGWYWSATEYPDVPASAWMERFSVGVQVWFWKGYGASVRPVRSEPCPPG